MTTLENQLCPGAPQSVGAAHFGAQFEFGGLGQWASFFIAYSYTYRIGRRVVVWVTVHRIVA